MPIKPIAAAVAIGTLLQVAMVLAGHVSPGVAGLFMIGGLGFSFLAGLVYGRMAKASWSLSLAGGVVAGASCAFIGLATSALLKDVPPSLLVFGTAGSAVTGLIGAATGKAMA